MRIGPGGGEAPQQAERQWRICAEALAQRLAGLKVKDLDEAEAIAERRGALEAELQQLRQAASAIPWARLQRDASDQQERRQRLAVALQPHAARLEQLRQRDELPEGREALEQWRDALAAAARQLEEQRSGWLDQLQQLRRSGAEQDQQQRSGEQRLQQLLGSLAALEERLHQLHERHGDLDGMDRQLAEQERELLRRREALTALEQQISSALEAAGCPAAADPGQLLSLLQAEKEALLTRRGQHQQAIQSLSAQDPTAAVEQSQAELEQADAACSRLELQARALQHLLRHLDEARRQLSERYSQPLTDAVTRYLDCLACPGYRPGLDFEPSAGLSNLQLSQGGEGFRFEELSGGMREQLNGALRLAMAELLQPAYDGVLPLLFDDAFTSSDPSRLSGLRRMLELAIEQGLQIVLLSCTPDLYAPLVQGGGMEHHLES
ncbi:ATP-binding protein [Synechococcus sp. GFB01]|uniref:ATP-binding protein n=1 Tax=Synechococcus sp. GFB01 TaxID=1662190 RepID=UPI00064F669A|nr:hypothetical protein [Synechococcus sp. GFB01]KMM17360.1 hypothetical protein SYNGFB01_04530 [Synechococcus sp. GFB01]